MTAQQESPALLSTDHLRADLKRRSVRGGLMTIASQGIQLALTAISTIVMARLLAPSDFGLVAMVTAITGLAQAFADLGLSEATIQREDLTERQVTSLFWINVLIGLALMMATAGMAPVLAWFYGDTRLIAITLTVSLTFLIGGLRVQHDALIRRQMRFTALTIRDVASCGVCVLVGVVMASRGAGYWAIIGIPMTFNFCQMALSWAILRWIPGLPHADAEIRSLIGFGCKVAASYMIRDLSRSADCVLIGWYWGPGPLGLYSRAFNLLMLPVRQLSAPARSVAIPALSRMQNDPEGFARYYLRMLNLMVWISAPVLAFLAVSAEPVIILTLGSKWREAAPVFQILALAAICQLLLETTAWLLVSQGRSELLLKLLMVMSPIMVCSFIAGLPFGIKGVALAGSLVMLGIFPPLLHFVFRATELRLQRLVKSVVYPVSLAMAGILLVTYALHMLRPSGLLDQLVVASSGFAIVFALSLLLTGVRQELLLLKELLMTHMFSRTRF